MPLLVLNIRLFVSSEPLSELYSKFEVAVRCAPSLAATLRPHLPRPRIMRALLDAAFPAPSPEDVFVRIGVFQTMQHDSYDTFSTLERLVRLKGECGRRGCAEPAKARCSKCQIYYYCGAECQRRSVCILWSFVLKFTELIVAIVVLS